MLSQVAVGGWNQETLTSYEVQVIEFTTPSGLKNTNATTTSNAPTSPIAPSVLPEEPLLTFSDHEEPATAPPLTTSLSFTESRGPTPAVSSRNTTLEPPTPPVPMAFTPVAQPAIDVTAMATAIALALRQANAGGGSKKGVTPPHEFLGGDDYVDFH
ncbi:hypothetical protein ACEPAG_3618 [Sanghuangporus baumii]